MPRASAFPTDSNGKYVNLSTLKGLKNGDVSVIKSILGPNSSLNIPDAIIQSGSLTNYETVETRVYFKNKDHVSVTYQRNDGQLITSKLKLLVQRGF